MSEKDKAALGPGEALEMYGGVEGLLRMMERDTHPPQAHHLDLIRWVLAERGKDTRHPAPHEAVETLIEAAGHHDCMRHETYQPGIAPGCELCDAIARVQSDNGGAS